MCSAGTVCIGNGNANSNADCAGKSSQAQECCSCECQVNPSGNPKCTSKKGTGGVQCLLRRFPQDFPFKKVAVKKASTKATKDAEVAKDEDKQQDKQ